MMLKFLKKAIGGRARVFKKSGYTFDAGPTVITAPFYLMNYLKYLIKKRKIYKICKVRSMV